MTSPIRVCERRQTIRVPMGALGPSLDVRDWAMIPTMIRDATPQDAPAIAAIYNPYILDTEISFEEVPLSDTEMARRVTTVQNAYPWLVLEEDGQIEGFAYATRWKERHAYRYCAETCIYLKQGTEKRGLGTALYAALLPRLPALDVNIAIACIALPNAPSVALHEKFGFTKVGHFPQVGFKFDRWIDVGFWQVELTAAPMGTASAQPVS